MSSYVESKRPQPIGGIYVPQAAPPPKPPQEKPLMLPNDAQLVNAMRRIHVEGYHGELQRAGGIFEAPDPPASQIFDPRFPIGAHVIDDYSLSVWTGRYVGYFATYAGTGDRHEYAIRAVIQNLHDSDEARQKRGEHTPPSPPVTPPSALVPLTIQGTTFRRPDGTIWKYRAVTAFSAFQDFLAGRDLAPYAAWTRSVGGNAWRVFYTWTITGFNPVKQLGAVTLRNELEHFRAWMDAQGLYSHNVAWCDQDPDPKKGSLVVLSQGDRDLLLDTIVGVMQGRKVEVMNEAYQNGGYAMSGAPSPERFHGTLAMRSAVRDGEDPRLAGSLLGMTTQHDPRDDEWPRKAKNVLETTVQGIGTIPPTKQPGVGGEPMGIFEQDIPGSRTANASDVADYYAVAELFGAGACLHGDGTTLQRCTLPGPNAQRCAEWAKAAREAIPADAQLGSYTRGGLDDCPIEHDDALALRTFFMLQGNRATGVVVRPQPGWEPRARNGWSLARVAGPNGHIITLTR